MAKSNGFLEFQIMTPVPSRWFASCLLLGLLSLSACAHGPRDQRGYSQSYPQASQQGYYGGDYRGAQQFVQYGYVRTIEQLGSGGRYESERSGNSGAGAVVGGVLGGVVGNQMGRGEGRAAATVIGAVAGAVIGNEIERQEGRREERRSPARFRVWVRLEGAGEQAFDFERLDGLRVGERVRVVDGRLQRF